jgi:hypothetical protein
LLGSVDGLGWWVRLPGAVGALSWLVDWWNLFSYWVSGCG